MTNEIPDDVKRWTAKRRQALVLQIVRDETTAVEAARQHGLTVGEIEACRAASVTVILRSRMPESYNQVIGFSRRISLPLSDFLASSPG